jgi:hypothetical protein
MKPTKLNIGCGHVHLPGYIRVDIDPATHPDICCSAEDLSEHVKPATVDHIRAYHIIEHIHPGRPTFRALTSFRQALTPGGTLHVAVPDCDHAMGAYADKEIGLCKAEKIIMGSDGGATEYMLHRQMFTIPKLRRYLHITGYIDIEDISEKCEEIIMKGTKPDGNSSTAGILRQRD